MSFALVLALGGCSPSSGVPPLEASDEAPRVVPLRCVDRGVCAPADARTGSPGSSPRELPSTAGDVILWSGQPGCGLSEDDNAEGVERSWTSSLGGRCIDLEVEGVLV